MPAGGDRDQLLQRLYLLVHRADGHVLVAKPDGRYTNGNRFAEEAMRKKMSKGTL